VKKVLLDLLVCPTCLPAEHPLHADIVKEMEEDILSGSLICPQCGRIYPIRDGLAFLDPRAEDKARGRSKYETLEVLSSYLWSHYGDIMGEAEALPAYAEWAGLIENHAGFSLDIGSATGRFTFELSRNSDFVIGVDNSVAFAQTARELMLQRHLEVILRQEGSLHRQTTVRLPEDWDSSKVEFLIADAQALPFRGQSFAVLASLNLLDKVARPLQHLREVNRVASHTQAQLLCSDPFSWSREVASQEDWLGGTDAGPFAGQGLDNVMALLQGGRDLLLPPWRISDQGHVWWKIRTHRNHFELIRSCFVKAER
jgi:uncharacterized protein YbaR (Trm112 family)